MESLNCRLNWSVLKLALNWVGHICTKVLKLLNKSGVIFYLLPCTQGRKKYNFGSDKIDRCWISYIFMSFGSLLIAIVFFLQLRPLINWNTCFCFLTLHCTRLYKLRSSSCQIMLLSKSKSNLTCYYFVGVAVGMALSYSTTIILTKLLIQGLQEIRHHSSVCRCDITDFYYTIK